MKKIISMLLVGSMLMLTACSSGKAPAESTSNGTQANVTSAASESEKGKTGDQLKVALSLGDASDYYIGTMVGEKMRAAFEEAGASVQILDAQNDVATQINQIQNAVTSGVNIIYLFSSGDGPTYADALQLARQAGVKTLVSNNYPGDGVADVYVGCDEFQMGVMMSAMVSKWVDATYPDAAPGTVDVLTLESSLNQNSIKRCLGMRMINEKFLREGDLATMYFKKTNGNSVTYIDADGKEVPVDEPTGGLLLDENGHAQLNPYYNPKVNLVEYSNRNNTGYDSTEAQKAIENAVTMGHTGLTAVMSYGDTGAAIDTKMRELKEDGRITTDIDKMAVFCSDLTDTNRDLILKSAKNESVLRGVMASGDLISTLQKYAKAIVDGEDVPAYTMEPLSYVMSNSDGSDVESAYYNDGAQLPDTSKFFPN